MSNEFAHSVVSLFRRGARFSVVAGVWKLRAVNANMFAVVKPLVLEAIDERAAKFKAKWTLGRPWEWGECRQCGTANYYYDERFWCPLCRAAEKKVANER